MSQKIKELYQACKELIQLEEWKQYMPTNPIVIKPSLSQENGYCIFMDDGINIYFGERGYNSFIELMMISPDEINEQEAFKTFYRQDMVRISFGDFQDLNAIDNEQLEKSEVDFSEEKQWPIIHRFNPGMVPYKLIDKNEIQFVTIILKQLKKVLKELKEGIWKLEEEDILMSVQQEGEWKTNIIDEIKEFEEDEKATPYYFEYSNDLKIHRLKKLPQMDTILEGIQFFLPEPYLDEESNQAIFPVLTAFVERGLGVVHLNNISTHKESELKGISDKLADLMLNDLNYRPREIIVEDFALLEMIENFCEQIGVQCYNDYVPQAIEFMESIMEFRGIEDELFEEDNIEDDGISQEDLNKILKLGTELDKMIQTTPNLKQVSKVERESILEVFLHTSMYMGLEQWSEKAFKDYLNSDSLHRELEVKFHNYIYPSMVTVLECLDHLKVLKNSNDLIEIVNEYCQE